MKALLSVKSDQRINKAQAWRLLVQEVVLSADFRCAECQKRVADVISKMNQMESVVVNVLEKKVTLTCRYSGVVKVPTRRVAAIYRNPPGKVAMFMRIFRSSCR